MVYSAPPQNRLGVMKHILEFITEDAGLRNILTDPELHMKPPRADNRLNITKAANAYTQAFYGLSVRKFIQSVQSGQPPEGIPLTDAQASQATTTLSAPSPVHPGGPFNVPDKNNPS
jgi:hypothetical protein